VHRGLALRIPKKFILAFKALLVSLLCCRTQPGDKIVNVSASFGSDVWDAINYGQTMYAIRTRAGSVYLKFKKNYGDMSAFEVCPIGY